MSINLLLTKKSLFTLAQQLVDTVNDVMSSQASELKALKDNTLIKDDGSVVTHFDHLLEKNIKALLTCEWPDFDFLSEEMSVRERAQVLVNANKPFWCLDPLDGTGNFSTNIPFWGVSLGFIDHDQSYLGIVYDYTRNECFTALIGEGAFLNGHRLEPGADVKPLDQCMANIDFKRLDKKLASYIVNNQKFRSQRNFGSCALEWCWLAMNRIQVSLHGGMKLWDYAAGGLILTEAGGIATTIDAQRVFNPRRENSSVLAAFDSEIFESWREYLGQA